MSRPIYFDYNATTPLDPRVRARMVEVLEGGLGNPSSLHASGRRARSLVETARAQVAKLIGAQPEEIVFTSGGTEADNLAILGMKKGMHLVVSAVEHPAVRGTAEALAREGIEVTVVPVDGEGRVSSEAVLAALRPHTALCSVQWVNHELGTLQPIERLAALLHDRAIPLHTDAVQAAGRIPIDVGRVRVDLLSVSAHKLHGPVGVGALYVRRGFDLRPIITGGHQERQRRAGTENVAGIAGFGVAASLAREEGVERATRVASLRERLERGVTKLGARIHGQGAERVAGTTNFAFDGVPGELLLASLDLEGISVSTGAACSSGSVDPSAVLLALGLERKRAAEGVRVSLGKDSAEGEVDQFLELLPRLVDRIRASKATD